MARAAKTNPNTAVPALAANRASTRAHATSLLILIQSQFCKGRLVVDSDRSRLESDNYPFSMGTARFPNPMKVEQANAK